MNQAQTPIKVFVRGGRTEGVRILHVLLAAKRGGFPVEVIGVSKYTPDFVCDYFKKLGIPLFVETEQIPKFHEANIKVEGTVEEALQECDLVVDCTPKDVANENAQLYPVLGIASIHMGGVSPKVVAHAYMPLANHEETFDSLSGKPLGDKVVRLDSCNEHGLLTTILPVWWGLNKPKSLDVVSVLVRRGKEFWIQEGPNDCIKPDRHGLSHHRDGVMLVRPEIKIQTRAWVTSATHIHGASTFVNLSDYDITLEDVLEWWSKTPRLTMVTQKQGISSSAEVKLYAHLQGYPMNDMVPVVLQADTVALEDSWLTWEHYVDQMAVVTWGVIDLINAMFGFERNWRISVANTDALMQDHLQYLPRIGNT